METCISKSSMFLCSHFKAVYVKVKSDVRALVTSKLFSIVI